MSASPRLLLASVLVLSAMPRTAAAQHASTPAWGITSESSEVISAWEMESVDSGATWLHDNVTNYRYLTSPNTFLAAVHVPNGAVIDYLELDACDSSAMFAVSAGLNRSDGQATDNLAVVNTGLVEADNCSRWRSDLETPETVDTQTYNYFVYAANNNFDGTCTIGAVRVYYHLQVSPAPAQASFGDVPTDHPFFQFVEALAASGITAGCGNGNFCPDAPLTRGQMAVFLSKAIGLHWPVESGSN
jgi:hypothetical protein